jgi:hypothetical protein
MVVHMDTAVTPLTSAADALARARTIIEDVVWCTLATVGLDGTPRTRVVHPIWDWEACVGWITRRGTPRQRRHLEHQAAVSCAYWSPAQHVAYVDAVASWVPDADKGAVWDRCLAELPPMGFDPVSMFPEGPSSEGFAPIRLDPHRIRVVRVGEPPLLWAEPRAR